MYNGSMKSNGITVVVSVWLLLAAVFCGGCLSWPFSSQCFSDGATLFRLDDLARDGFSPTNGPVRTATVEVGRSISFVLEENATTSYRWCLAEPGNGGRDFVTLDHRGPDMGADGKARCGASGRVTVTVKPPRSGDYRILLAYRRAWERKPPIATVEVKVRAFFREDVDGADEVREKWGGATLEEALASCRLMAKNGDEDAKFDMGRYNEEGIGMPKCRDEAIRWYGKILPWSSPRRDGFIEEVTRRQARLLGIRIPFDPKTADGCVIRDFLAAETNEVVGTCLVRLLTEQIRGRRLTLTNLIVRTSNLQNDGALGMKLDMPESGDKWNSHRTVFARFCGDDIRMASHLDENDRIDEFTGTVVDKGRSMANLQFEDVSFRTSDPLIDAPVPPFDAASITGDELVEFIRRQPRPFRRWQFDEISERLAGRRLEFHDFRFGGGMTLAIRPGEYSMFSAVPKWVPFGTCDGSMECRFYLIPSNREQERKMRRLYGGGFGNGIASLSGVVRKGMGSGRMMQLEDIDFVMDGAIPIPGRTADGLLDGDEIVRELKYSPNGIGAETFCAAVTGQTIRFSSAIVDRCYPVPTNRTSAVVFCRVTPKLKLSAGSRDGWYVKFKLPIERESALRRALVPGDLLVGLTGRIKGHASGTLRLKGVTFDVKWQKDALEPQDFAKATGDDLLRALALCRPDMREDAFHRVVRGLNGRRVTFSRGVVESAETDADGNVACRVSLGCDLFDSIVSVEATFAKGKGVDAIRKGARLDGLSGVLSDELIGLEPTNNASRRFILRDASTPLRLTATSNGT